jgi:NAD(P)-dependent dehydrogenase (short-subunit alcohol dehydrogenase family)
MPFPSGRRSHPADPTRPQLGPPVPVGTTDMTGRTVVITGGAGSIGTVVAERLARQGARLVLVDVRAMALEQVAADLRASTGATVDTIVADLASTPDVHRLAVELRAHHPRIDVLINNAGRYSPRYATSADGHELTLASNHLGHFLLTNLLLDRLQESSARVVFVSSDAHWQAKTPDWDDMNVAKAWKGKESNPGAGFAAYNQSKLILTATAMELAERTRGTGMTVNVVVPGALVPTGIYDELTGPPALFVKVMRPVLRTPEKASTGFVYLASSPEVEGVSGWYWKDVRAIDESMLAQDPDLRRRLWDWSADAVGIGTPAP